MAGKLSAVFVNKASKPGRYPDGQNLYLQVSRWGTKAWLFRYTRHGRSHALGLGPVLDVSLKDAREAAARYRAALREGRDPLAEKRSLKLRSSNVMSFDECCAAYIEAHGPSWKNKKHRDQWRNTLATYASPKFGNLPVSEVDTGLVVRALEPIWVDKTETAVRLRGRIESVLGWAAVRGLRSGDNPARWRGHLDKLLPSPGKVANVNHHAALPYQEIGKFMAELRGQNGAAVHALEFAILTAARTIEVIGAQWAEFDLAEEIWTVAAERMKSKREHRVPLSPAVIKTLKKMQGRDGRFVFPGQRHGSSLSNMAMLSALRRMERDDCTVHGFRSTFRDWCSETTAYSPDVAEMALAHVVKNQTEAAYRRGDLFEKRRRLMNDWARYCNKAPTKASVTPIKRRSRG